MNPADINSPTLLSVGVIEQLTIFEPSAVSFRSGDLYSGEV